MSCIMQYLHKTQIYQNINIK